MDTLNIFSPSLNSCDSFGVIAHQLHKHLIQIGLNVNMLGWHPSQVLGTPTGDGSLYLGWPTMFPAFPVDSGPRIAISMFESTKLPMGWNEILSGMDSVIVPSEFCRDVFLNCGVTAPLHMYPLGVDEIYKPARRTQRDTITFLAFMDRGIRKGGLVALRAFQKAFGGDPRYQLILKGRKPGTQVILFDNPNIRLIQADMTEKELYELYLQTDCLINPNMGEGFGMIPRCYAATGGVTLATNYGGTADDIGAWGWPIPYELVPADWSGQPGLDGQDLGVWAKPDVDQLASLLKDVADRRDFYQSQTEATADNVRQLYSWKAFAEQIYGVWKGCV